MYFVRLSYFTCLRKTTVVSVCMTRQQVAVMDRNLRVTTYPSEPICQAPYGDKALFMTGPIGREVEILHLVFQARSNLEKRSWSEITRSDAMVTHASIYRRKSV